MNIEPLYHPVTQETLDSLFYEAETLGKITVNCYSREYSVSIMFETRSGSTIFAYGKAREIKAAFAKAINEAREYGA